MTSSTVIAHELSSDIATAILSVKDHFPRSLDELKEIGLEGSTEKIYIKVKVISNHT